MPDILDQNQKSSSNDPATTPNQSDQGAGPSSADPIAPVTPGSPADAALPAAPVDISDLLRPGADAPKEEQPVGGDTVVPSSSVAAPSDALPSEPAPAPLSDVTLPMDTNLVVPAVPDQQPDGSHGAGHSGKPPKLSGRKFGTGGKRNLVIGLALLFLLVSTGLVFVFVNQQQSLNDIRNRAAGELYNVACYDACVKGGGLKCKDDCATTPTAAITPLPNGVGCSANDKCASGFCEPNTKTCRVAPTPSPVNQVLNTCYEVNRCNQMPNDAETQDCRRECQANAPGTIALNLIHNPTVENCYIVNNCSNMPNNEEEQSCRKECQANPVGIIEQIASGSCPAGTRYDTSIKKCVGGAEGTCSAGSYYDAAQKKCIAKPASCANVKCTSTGCSLGSNPPAGCFISHYRCPGGSVQPGQSCDSRNGELLSTNASGTVSLGACGIQQIDIYCPACGITSNTVAGTFASQFNNTANCNTGGGYSYSQGTYITNNTPTPTRTPTPTSVVTNTPTPTSVITNTPTPTSVYTPTPTQPGYAYSQATYQSYSYSQGTYTTGNTPTPTPPSYAYCNQACTVNTDCGSGLVCLEGVCRNPSCSDSASCSCGTTVAPTPKVPVAGAPSVIGMTTIVGAVFLLLLGLVL
jgi:hypothetical protein